MNKSYTTIIILIIKTYNKNIIKKYENENYKKLNIIIITLKGIIC